MDNLERKEALQARVNKLEAEIARREASKKPLTTSERQADYVLRANRREEPAEDRDVEREVVRTWGEGLERPELDGDVTSRRQATRITRGRSS